MATIKSYTDKEQSKKLAEILPIESADMYYSKVATYPKILTKSDITHANVLYGLYDIRYFNIFEMTPAWSLAALLDVLPDEISIGEGYQNKYEIDIRRYYGGNNITLYQIAYCNNKGSSGSWHDVISTSEQEKFVDVCYEMICWLKENNIL